MTRYKGRTSFKTIEREFSHHVDIRVPVGGLRKRLDGMYAWHQARGIQAMHGHGQRDESNRDIIRWCFADRKIATAFVREFGGISKRWGC